KVAAMFNNAKQFNQTYLLKIYAEDFPEFLFAAWAITGNKPEKATSLIENITSRNFYHVQLAENDVKQLDSFFTDKFNIKLLKEQSQSISRA
ncbi:MAG: hypothetical protein ACK4M7_06345, partial [Burkholderiales bacterium]